MVEPLKILKYSHLSWLSSEGGGPDGPPYLVKLSPDLDDAGIRQSLNSALDMVLLDSQPQIRRLIAAF